MLIVIQNCSELFQSWAGNQSKGIIDHIFWLITDTFEERPMNVM